MLFCGVLKIIKHKAYASSILQELKSANLILVEGTIDSEKIADKNIRKLYRDSDDIIIAGVSAGIAHYLQSKNKNLKFDVWVIRILFIILIFINGIGLIVYIVLWATSQVFTDFVVNANSWIPLLASFLYTSEGGQFEILMGIIEIYLKS
ncbi:TPA: PspC domain-containing protein, partial [Candidatus Gracilibacteria bacterium]|nr:PspC domain-containing protein [Candidatus Gracilibacteria bacterium]